MDSDGGCRGAGQVLRVAAEGGFFGVWDKRGVGGGDFSQGRKGRGR